MTFQECYQTRLRCVPNDAKWPDEDCGRFEKPPKQAVSDEPTTIAVMGITGVGKSTFIQKSISGFDDYSSIPARWASPGSSSENCQVIQIESPASSITCLVDSPRFDYSSSDSELLREIASTLRGWLAEPSLQHHQTRCQRMNSSTQSQRQAQLSAQQPIVPHGLSCWQGVSNTKMCWVCHYRRAEPHSDVLPRLLDRCLDDWARSGEGEQCDLKSKNRHPPNFLRSPLHFCSATGFEISTRAYLEMGYNPNALAQPSGQTALHLAVAGGQLDTIKLLLDWGADLEIPTFTTRRTPLHIAAFRGCLDICIFLLEAGASLKATDQQWQSSLQIAASNGYVDICKLLIEKGADVKVRDCQGRTALDLALASKHDKVVGLLLGVEVERMSFGERMALNETGNDTGASPALPEPRTAVSEEHINQVHNSEIEGWVSVDFESEGDSTYVATEDGDGGTAVYRPWKARMRR
jgi:hypothetical protein